MNRRLRTRTRGVAALRPMGANPLLRPSARETQVSSLRHATGKVRGQWAPPALPSEAGEAVRGKTDNVTS
jgi:hypothetical protein